MSFGQHFAPEIFNRLAFGEEAVPANVEVETFIGNGARDSAHVGRVGFQHDHLHFVFGEQIGGGQAGRSGPNDRDSRFHIV